MLSACEDCLSLFPAEMTTCPLCQQATDWLCQTYDVDGHVPVMPTQPSSTAEVR